MAFYDAQYHDTQYNDEEARLESVESDGTAFRGAAVETPCGR
jgi:hypothetical protein